MNNHFELFVDGKFDGIIWKIGKYWIGTHFSGGRKSFRKAYAATLKTLDLKNRPRGSHV